MLEEIHSGQTEAGEDHATLADLFFKDLHRLEITRATKWFALSVVYVRVLFMASETFKKRQKEMARQTKQKEKMLRRRQRKEEKATAEPQADGEDPDIAGIRPGPQPKLD